MFLFLSKSFKYTRKRETKQNKTSYIPFLDNPLNNAKLVERP